MSVVAEAFSGEWRSGIWAKNEELENFLEDRDYTLWIETNGEFQEAPRDVKKIVSFLAGGAVLYRLQTAPFEAACLWKAPTSDGHECAVEAKIRVGVNSEVFLKNWSKRIRASKRLSSFSVENELIGELETDVAEEIKTHAFDGLKYGGDVPQRSWKFVFERRVEKLGLTFDSVGKVDYDAPTLEHERELEKREAARQEAIEQKRADADAEIRLAEIEAEKTERARRIEHDAFLSEAQRREERETLEAEMETRRKKIERDAELQSLEHEKKRLELEAEIEKIKNRLEESKDSQERLRRLEERREKFADETNRFFQAVQDAKESGLAPSAQLATRVSGISDETFDRLTPRDSKERFSRFFEDAFKRAPTSKRVDIAVNNTKTRSVGDANIKTLKIDELLDLEFTSPIDGYVSVLNLGTERFQPNYVLLVPNKRVEPRQAKANKGETAYVSSGKFKIEGIKEFGPCGWEEFVVLITKEPLFNDEDRVGYYALSDVFAAIPTDRLRRILERLATLEEDDWAIGWIGFNVVDR